MTIVVLGLDALDPDLVDPDAHPNLTLASHTEIETIPSSATAEPSTHELWPTIFTGLRPEEHGLQLESGITWENPLLDLASSLGNALVPHGLRTKIGAWILQNTDESPFRTPASYYGERGIDTLFDNANARAIGVPNYVVNPDERDREHELRRDLGDLFRLDTGRNDGHKHDSSDPHEFYELCLEMSMIRIARTRRAVRRREYELVFAYTSGLDLVGHVAYADSGLQERAYEEIDEFVGELRGDLQDGDELVLVSDHGLKEGLHTDSAMIAATAEPIVADVGSVLDFRSAIEHELSTAGHQPRPDDVGGTAVEDGSTDAVREHLEDLGYM